MSTIITPSEDQINIVITDDAVNVNITNEPVVVNVTEGIIEVSTVSGAYPLPTTVYSVFGRTGSVIAQDGDYDLGELGDVTLVNNTNGDVLTFDGTKWINKAVTGTGTVTSVDMTVPVGLEVSGNPITQAGTLAVNFANGYSIPTNAKQTNWDSAYNDKIISADVSGTTSKTLTLHQQDGGTIVATWTDIDTNLVTSVNGYLGDVVLTTTDIAEGTRLYYTEARVSANVDVAANTAKRHDALTIGTANGLSLSSQVLSLALASASTTGALSSTDWSTFNNKVPYTGATGDVNLGEHQLLAGQITFDQSPTGASGVGIMRWNNTDGTLDLGLKGGNVTLQLGQEIVARVVNKTGSDLLESGYNVVRISNAQGQRLAVQLAQANNDTNSTDTIGIVTETIENNQEGFITILGQVREIDTTGSLQGETWADGDILYLSPTTAGRITNIKPLAPQHMVVVGYVEYAHSQHGKIYCKVQNGYELEELHDCYLPTYVSNGVLYRDTTTNLWKNASIPTVLGYTPANDASVVHIAGSETITGSKTFSTSVNNDDGLKIKFGSAPNLTTGYLTLSAYAETTPSPDRTILRIGTSATQTSLLYFQNTGSYQYTLPTTSGTLALTSDLGSYITLNSLSATAPLSYNNLTGNFSISQAGVSSNGYLSSTDWNTFNNKQAAGNYITSLTGEATASGPGAASVTLSTSAVTGKLLTGINITGGSISATDSILVALGKAQNQINALLGGSIFQTTWNASTNTPSLTSSVGTKGYYYIVDVAGSTNLNGITDWRVGDWAIFDGSVWRKVDNTDAVSSVNGFTGAVSLTTDNISEGLTNLYYTESRVNANTNVAANTAARHAAVTLGTANGLSLSTQQLSLGLSSSTTTGALSSTDWSVFNAKQSALNGTGFVKISGTTISYDNSSYYLASNPSAYIALTALSAGAGISYNNLTGVISSTITQYTDAMARASLSFAAGSGAYNSTTGVITIPTNTNQLTNGAGYTTNTGTVTSVATTGPITGGTITGSGTIGITQATTTTSGYLSSTDWNTFNNKQSALTNPVTGTGTTNYLPKFTGTSTIGNSLVYDNGTNVGIGTTSPSNKLTVYDTQAGNTTQLRLGYNDNFYWDIGRNDNLGGLEFKVRDNLIGPATRVLFGYNGNVLIGTTTDSGYKLDVTGTGRFSGQLNNTQAGHSTIGLYLSSYQPSGINWYDNDDVEQYSMGIIANSGNGYWGLWSSTSSTAIDRSSTTPIFKVTRTGAATFSSSVTATSGFFTGFSINGTPSSTGTSQTFVEFRNTGGDFYIGKEGSTGGGFFTGAIAYDNIFYSDRPYNFIISAESRMYINTSGNVGIGTTSPRINTEIFTAGSSFTSSTYTINFGTTKGLLLSNSAGTSQSGNGIWFDNSGLFSGISSTRVDTGTWGTDLRFYTHPDSTTNQYDVTERMRITSGGVVQIANSGGTLGTLVGSERLNVNGGIYAYGDIISGGTITFANNVVNYGGNTNYKGATGSGDVTLSNNGSALLVTGPLQKNYGSSIKFIGNGSSSYDVDFLNAGFTTKTVKVLGSLHLETTGSSFVIPRMTTTERDALNANNKIAGAMIYNTSVGHFQGYNGTGWTNFW